VFGVVFGFTPVSHKFLWRWINEKLDRNTPIMQNSFSSMCVWIVGTAIGIELWSRLEGLKEIIWYEVGWIIAIWLGGMLALSLMELFYVFWNTESG